MTDGKINSRHYNILHCLLWGGQAWQSPRAALTTLGTPCYKSSLVLGHCMFGPSFLQVIISRKFWWLLRQGQSKRLLKKYQKSCLKHIFTLPVFLGNVIDLGKRIHAVTKETGHVIKNSLILPRKNSIPNKLHANSYPFLNQMKLPKRMQVISTCLKSIQTGSMF